MALEIAEQAERTVVGGILLHPDSIVRVVDVLAAEDIGTPALRSVYAAQRALAAKQRPIDVVTVEQQMRDEGTWKRIEPIGGRAFLEQLMGDVVTVENLRHHALTAAKRAARYRLVHELAELTAQGKGDLDDDAYLAEAGRSLLRISGKTQVGDGGPEKAIDIVRGWQRDYGALLQRKAEGHQVLTGIPSGWADLDEITGGWQLGDLVVAAGRPSMGKTAWTLQQVVHLAALGIPSLGFSLEMRNRQLIERALANQANVDGQLIRQLRVNTREWVRLTAACSVVADWPMWIDETARTVSQIQARAWRWRQQIGADRPAIVWVDYLQLLASEGKGRDDNRSREVGEQCKALKQLGADLRCPVVVLSQLNRGLENREDKRPRMSDLRESGDIEAHADVIAFLYRDEVYSKDECKPEDRGVAEVIIGKQRNGPCLTARLLFEREYSRFRPAPTPPPERVQEEF